MSEPFTLSLYRAGSAALAPFAPLVLGARARQGKEDPARIGERLGRSIAQRPDGKLVWLHGASVGEMGVLLQVQAALAARDPQAHFLVTTGTRSSAELFARRPPPRAQHVYAPVDTPGAVKRFLDHWRPDIGILAESELWPNLVLGAHTRGIPLALVNARMSPRTLARWDSRKRAARSVFDAFSLILAADQRTADALTALSGRPVERSGNIKFSAPAPPVDAASLAHLRAAIGQRPVWLAASTHEGEDEALIAAHALLLSDAPNALLIIAPRHPERGGKVAALAADAPQRAKKAPIGEGAVYIADTLGELGLFYAAAPVSVIGGSLLAHLKGHNPIEPAKLKSAILTGPYVESFADAFDALHAAGGARTVTTPAEIAAAVAHLWRDDAARTRLTDAAARVAGESNEALQRTIARLDTLAPRSLTHAPA